MALTPFYVKKICSLNPKKFKQVAFDDAIESYASYVFACATSRYLDLNYKDFNTWLKTEI